MKLSYNERHRDVTNKRNKDNVANRVMVPKNVHILIPASGNLLLYVAKGTSQM